MTNVQSITDTVKVGRAWNNRLNNINELLSWMYEENILNKTLKAKKDRIFRTYYRYYNDGDIPKGYKGVDKVWTEKYLENIVNELIAEILRKTHGKYDRKDFRNSRKLQQLNTLDRQARDFDCHSLFTYFSKKIKVKGQTAYEYFGMNLEHAMYNVLDKKINVIINRLDQSDVEYFNRIESNFVICYRIEQLEKRGENLITPEVRYAIEELESALYVLRTSIDAEIEEIKVDL